MRIIYFEKGKKQERIFFSHFFAKDGYYTPCDEQDKRMDEFFNYALFKEKDNGDSVCVYVKGPGKNIDNFQQEIIDNYLSAGFIITVNKTEQF